LAAARDRGRWAATDPHLINGLVAVLGMLAVTEIVYQIGWYHFRHYTSQQVDSPDRISIVFYCYDASPQKTQLNSAGDRGR